MGHYGLKKAVIIGSFAVCILLTAGFIYKFLQEKRYSSEFPKPLPTTIETYTVRERKISGLVDNFPEHPVYPGSEVIESNSYKEDGGIGFEVKYRTKGDKKDIALWYENTLMSKRWNILYYPKDYTQKTLFLSAGLNDEKLSVDFQSENENLTIITINHQKGMGEVYPEQHEIP